MTSPATRSTALLARSRQSPARPSPRGLADVRGGGSERPVGFYVANLAGTMFPDISSIQQLGRSVHWLGLPMARAPVGKLGDRSPKWPYLFLAGYGGLFVTALVNSSRSRWGAHAGLGFTLRGGNPKLRGGGLYRHVSLRSEPVFQRFPRTRSAPRRR